jgi:hypothetical protein
MGGRSPSRCPTRKHCQHIDPPDVAAAQTTDPLATDIHLHHLLIANLCLRSLLELSSSETIEGDGEYKLNCLMYCLVEGLTGTRKSQEGFFAYFPLRSDTEKPHRDC